MSVTITPETYLQFVPRTSAGEGHGQAQQFLRFSNFRTLIDLEALLRLVQTNAITTAETSNPSAVADQAVQVAVAALGRLSQPQPTISTPHVGES